MAAANSLPPTKVVCAAGGDSVTAIPVSPPAWMRQAGRALPVRPSLSLLALTSSSSSSPGSWKWSRTTR